jgi:hypothetical protein
VAHVLELAFLLAEDQFPVFIENSQRRDALVERDGILMGQVFIGVGVVVGIVRAIA